MQISKIIESINRYYNLAWNAPLISIAQELEDLTDKLTNAANAVKDETLSTDLKLLSREYARAVRMNRGFDSVANAAYMIYDDEYLSNDTPETQNIKKIILDIIANLRVRAGGKLLADETREPESTEQDETSQEETAVNTPLLYNDLMRLSKSLKNQTLSKELQLIAAVYLKATQINNGFNTVFNGIKDYLTSQEDVNDDNQISGLLTAIQADLISRAGGAQKLNIPDSTEVKNELRRAQLEQFEETSLLEEAQDFGHIEKQKREDFGDSGGSGLSFDEERKDDAGNELEDRKDKLDRGDLGTDKEGKGKPGFGVKTIYTPKQWVELFANEIKVAEAYYQTTTKQLIKFKYKQIIENNKKLIEALNKVKFIEKQVLLQTENPDPELQNQLQIAKTNVARYKKERTELFKPTRLEQKGELASSLKEKIKDISDPISKEIKQIEIDKLESIRSRTVNRGPTNILRDKLKMQLENKPKSGDPAALEKWNQRVNLLREQIKESLNKEVDIKQKNVETAKQIKELKESGAVDGLAIKLRQQINTARNEIKKAIKKEIKQKLIDEENTTFKEIKERLSQAILADNPIQIKAITAELDSAKDYEANAKALTDPRIITYEATIIPLCNFRDKCFEFIANGIFSGNIPDEKLEEVELFTKSGIEIMNKFTGKRTFGPMAETISFIIKKMMELINE